MGFLGTKIDTGIGVLIVLAAGLIAVLLVAKPIGEPHSPWEAVAITTLKQVAASQEAYSLRNGRYGTLEELAAAGSIEPELASRLRKGEMHNFRYRHEFGAKTWCVVAWPVKPGKRGSRHSFYVDQTGVIRFLPHDTAKDPLPNATSPSLDSN